MFLYRVSVLRDVLALVVVFLVAICGLLLCCWRYIGEVISWRWVVWAMVFSRVGRVLGYFLLVVPD